MPKFIASVTVTATFSYTVEVEAQDESKANDLASETGVLVSKLPDDFLVADGYCEFDFETEQLTMICPRCDKEHAVPTSTTEYWLTPAGAIAYTRDGYMIPHTDSGVSDEETCAQCEAERDNSEQVMLIWRYAQPFRYAQTSCSECGANTGPGNMGFSHCEDHLERKAPACVRY